MDKLPQMGDDAFVDGFLSKKFGNRIIDRANRDWQVFLPPGAGSGRVIESDQNICLDLTKAKMGWDGTWNQPSPPPYLPPWNLYPTMRGTLAIPFTYDSGTGTWACTNINHGLELNSPVTIALTTAGTGTMGSAFATATTYYARDTTEGTLKLSATVGGAAITGGTNGSGMTLVYTGLALKINPISTLMKTYDFRADWKNATWKDRMAVTNQSKTFVLARFDSIVWIDCTFDSAHKLTGATVKSGTRWSTNLEYVSADNKTSAATAFTWRQLLAVLHQSGQDNIYANDIKFPIAPYWYNLMCPTTTHLMQGYYIAADGSGGTTPSTHTGIVPWNGCLFETIS